MIQSENLLVKGNQLVEARYKLTIWESRVFAKMVTMIHKDDIEFMLYEINIKNLMDFFGTKSASDYERIRGVPEMLLTRKIRIPIIDKGKKAFYVTNIISAAIIPRGKQDLIDNSSIQLRFDPGLGPYLLKLKERFLKYDIQNLMRISSPHSIRIYELLKQYERIGHRTMTIDEIKEILGVKEKYSRYYNLKMRILKQAQKDLLEHTDIGFTFSEIKAGRKVHSIKFHIYQNPSKQQTQPSKKQKTPSQPISKEPPSSPVAPTAKPQPQTPSFQAESAKPFQSLKEILPQALKSKGMEIMINEGIKYDVAISLLKLFNNEVELLQEVRHVKQELNDRKNVNNKAGLMVKLLKEQNFKKKQAFKKAIEAQKKQQSQEAKPPASQDLYQNIDFDAHARQIEKWNKEYKSTRKQVVMNFINGLSEEEHIACVAKYRESKPTVCETIELANKEGNKKRANDLKCGLFIQDIPQAEYLKDFHKYLDVIHKCRIRHYEGKPILEERPSSS